MHSSHSCHQHQQASGDSVIEDIKDATGMYMALAQAKSRLLLACFTATWCRPCHEFSPKLEQLAQKYSQVVFVRLDVDKMSDLASQHNIQVLPTFVLFKGGYRIDAVSAASETKLEDLLKRNGAYPLH